MKTPVAVILAAVAAAAASGYFVHRRMASDHSEELAEREAAWRKEKTALEAAGKKPGARPAAVPVPVTAARPAGKSVPADLIARLAKLKESGGATRSAREAIHALEELIALGPAALPAIREFLERDEDFDFAFAGGSQGKTPRSLPDEFLTPPSLRFALLEAVRRIGGPDSEKLLAEVLATTGRGVELAWIARALEQTAPGKYREAAVGGARELLERPLAGTASPLDRNDRDHLFGVLGMFGDTGYVSTAQSQLVLPDGGLDRSALKYLQQVMGPQSIPIAVQTWNDARITDPVRREPLARLALNFAGADTAADAFYAQAINDLTLTKDQRRNLIEDLNEDGFTNLKNLTAADLPLIENRIALIEQLEPSAADPVNAEAFREAYKDLVNMRDRLTGPPPVK